MSDIVTGQVFTNGETGITATKMNNIVGQSVIQPAFYSAKPTASTADAADTLLLLKAAGTYAQAPVSTFVTSVAGQLPSSDPEIWTVRLRSFNAIGNPSFEVDQRQVGALLSNPANGTFLMDRWLLSKTGTAAFNWQQVAAGVGIPSGPGANFAITRSFLRSALTTQQPALAAGDLYAFYQLLEGPQWRELFSNPTSVTFLVRSSVANLKFSLFLHDVPATKSLVKLCTIPTANAWTLIQLPNLPADPGFAGVSPGQTGIMFGVSLAAGTTAVAPAADTWQTGGFAAAPGMDNFASKPVNSTIDFAFVQFEPGTQCSVLMDKPFAQNYDECLRYYAKSYEYGQIVGAASISTGRIAWVVPAAFLQNPMGSENFPKPLAKAPTMTIYSDVTGTPNAVRDNALAGDRGVSSTSSSAKRLHQMALASASTSGSVLNFHYVADTGW
jgi:hypothetical protein